MCYDNRPVPPSPLTVDGADIMTFLRLGHSSLTHGGPGWPLSAGGALATFLSCFVWCPR